MAAGRYIVGIDLGTTNCAVAYVDREAAEPRVEVLPLLQLVAPGQRAVRELLPSFLYLPAESEYPAGSLEMPWRAEDSYVVGVLARSRGAEVPGRLVSSAKSWLCHSGVDRRSPILPWKGPKDVLKISPVGATARLLTHIRDCWNLAMAREDPEQRLEAQEVLITVPASFDAVARELTQQAAEEAGLRATRLLEEPQAAFYAWIDGSGEEWRRQVRVGDMVLVFDVGGGTTDLSLISVSERDGELELERLAVGDHILLGGDNMDLALAHTLRDRLKRQGHKIDAWQLQALAHACREAKERLLADPELEAVPVAILGRGSGVVAGTVSTELTRQDLEQVLVEGFFPGVDVRDWPRRRWRLGFRELGLKYESEPAITRHLAAFLGKHARRQSERLAETGETFVCPTAVLFNGGVMKSPLLQEQLLRVLNGWLAEQGREPVRVLGGHSLDLSVARGAAYYGLARQGRGVRIRGGTARTYYIGIESARPAVPGVPPPMNALCIAPFGMEEGTEAEIPDREFGVIVGEPVQFPVLSSTVRKEDPLGAYLEEWEEGELEELPPLEAVLSMEGAEGEVIPVRLQTRITETGMLEIWCVARDGGQRWKLEFNLREEGFAD